MKKIYTIIIVILLISLLSASFSFSQPTDATGSNTTAKTDSKDTSSDKFSSTGKYAFIFNVPNLLLGVSAFQGGVGFSFGINDKMGIRLLFDFDWSKTQVNTNPDTNLHVINLTLGGFFVYKFLKGKVTPYIAPGISINLNIVDQEPTNSNHNITTIFAVNAILAAGVEIKVLDYMGLFAEYQFSFMYSPNSTVNVAGSTTSTPIGKFNLGAGFGLGNGGMIGMNIYF